LKPLDRNKIQTSSRHGSAKNKKIIEILNNEREIGNDFARTAAFLRQSVIRCSSLWSLDPCYDTLMELFIGFE
jgi:hypothetical protein